MARFILWLMFSWRGRISKTTFILAILALITLKNMALDLGAKPSAPAAICFLIGIWAVFALCAKRLHDLGWSVWWLLLYAPALGSIFGLLPQNIEVSGLVGYAELGIFIVAPTALFILLALKKGDEAANAHGVRTSPPPELQALGRKRAPVATTSIPQPAPVTVFNGAPRKVFGRRGAN